MKRRVLVVLVCLSLLASGCMTIGMALTDPKNTPRSHVVAGGLLGDVAIAGVGNAVKGEWQMGEAEDENHFFTYFLVLTAVDAAAAIGVWYLKRPAPDRPAPQ